MPQSPPPATALPNSFSYSIYPGSGLSASSQPSSGSQPPMLSYYQQQHPPAQTQYQHQLSSPKQYIMHSASQQQPFSPQHSSPPPPQTRAPQSYLPQYSYVPQQPVLSRPLYDDPKEPYMYTLKVVQQPIRARMCGFGDKDRRPITPPPCIQLIITDKATGCEADIAKLDVSFLALTVELWSVDETTNLSIVSTLPLSSGAAATTSFPQQQTYHNMSPSMPSVSAQSQAQRQSQRTPTPTFVAPPIKNLIGSVVATAFKLHDPQGNLGVWFILQDLSVRTEGEFKLKLSFVNLGSPLALPSDAASRQNTNSPPTSSSLASMQAASQSQDVTIHNGQPVMVVNTGTASIQATCFSQPFRVYIAKKFPGVIESTDLSRCFAMQGIKIPIRKDQKKSGSNSNSVGESKNS
ncbi:velvet factor-domain-containing protein [Kockiozyma suomiensis]|uniref:velvet factor-domain-containing protein n=1 Tax=Kockiozyma suomiensis TaxID=1337062 RepID=UPI003343C3ED